MKSRLALVAALALLLSGPAFAGGLGLYGSYWETEDLDDTAGGGVKYAFGDAGVRFELRGSYFPDVSNSFEDFGDDPDEDVDLQAIVPEAGITFNFSPAAAFQPYIGAGLSYYLLDLDLGPLNVETDDEVGYYALAGFETGRDSTGFFAEAVYRSVEGTVTDDDDILDDVDFDLSGFSINAGVVFRF